MDSPQREEAENQESDSDLELKLEEEPSPSSESDLSDSSSDSDYTTDDDDDAGDGKEAEDDNSPETNIRKFTEVLHSRRQRKRIKEEERQYKFYEDLFDFPRDPEHWTEEDNRELWADAPVAMTKPGWDPVWADEDDWDVVREEVDEGRDPPIAPFYLPYRKHYPVIPDNHFDISNPKSVIEELDRIEEFLKWVSYIFPDGSTYEGTVWDDLAHGKGVYVSRHELVRYEGEWLQNAMEGHGVVEVDIPDVQPVPGSNLEAKMRAEGRIISRDFMTPEDKKWLEMDIEDSVRLAGGKREIPFYENDDWIKYFGQKPEKGRYKYAGQWKHGRMHGCGVYEVNERIIYGRFYFGEHLDDSTGCDLDISALHAGIAEVAAAKARMFINKPDGMVREERGPYGDPQHPYLYEEEDVWMAPGFINQFYEVPDYWKVYTQEVDQEREMWLNSFHKSPLRIPMPAELEYWWAKADKPEFVLINKEPEPDPEDPSRLIYTEDPLILHTRTGRLINYVDDEEYGIRLFWQPRLKEGEEVDPEKVEFLPLGFDEFYGRATTGPKKESKLLSIIEAIENALKPAFDRLHNWTEERKKASEMNRKLIEKELEFIDAELSLKEAIEDMELELKMKQKEEERRAASGQDGDGSPEGGQDGAVSDEGEEEEGDEDGENEEAPSSFGTVAAREDSKGNRTEKSPFSSLSMAFVSQAPPSIVPSRLQERFQAWKKGRVPLSSKVSPGLCSESTVDHSRPVSLCFPRSICQKSSMKAVQDRQRHHTRNRSAAQLNALASVLAASQAAKKSIVSSPGKERSGNFIRLQSEAEMYHLNILSMHVPLNSSSSCIFNFLKPPPVNSGGNHYRLGSQSSPET